jgi:deferrochelatase/peroxidase EfeB
MADVRCNRLQPASTLDRSFNDVVWVGDERLDWMRGGSYVVRAAHRDFARTLGSLRDRLSRGVICRHKCSDAPIGKTNECDSLDVDRVDPDRNPAIVDNPPSGSERRRSTVG